VSNDGFRPDVVASLSQVPKATDFLLVELHAVEAAPTVGFADRREYRVG
jgi:hypothetical protein